MIIILLVLLLAYLGCGIIFSGWLAWRTWGVMGDTPFYVFIIAALVWPFPLAFMWYFDQWEL